MEKIMPKIVYTQGKGLIQSSSDGAVFAVPASGSDAPAITGDGTVTCAGTDVSGILTVAGELTNGQTCTVTFAEAHSTAPVVVISAVGCVDIAVSAVSATAFVLTASGSTGTGSIHYLVIAQA